MFGIVMGLVFKPGSGMDLSAAHDLTVSVGDSNFIDTLVGFIPSNIFDAMAKGTIIQVISFSLFFGIGLGLYPTKDKKAQDYATLFL